MHTPFAALSRNRRLVVASIFVVLFVFHTSAFGHARLVRSRPEANSTLEQAPKSVELWFSEELESTISTIIVTDQNGKHVDKNDLTVAEGNKKLQIDLEDLGSGTYTVEWKALSTDQHTMKGKFTFKVAVAETPPGTVNPTQQPSSAQTTEQPAPKGLAPPQASESAEESGSTWMMSVVRWLQYLAMMLLVGGFAFRLLVLRPALRADGRSADVAGTSDDAMALSQRRILMLSWLSAVLLIASTFIALVQQAAVVCETTMGESLSSAILGQVLTKTGYGGAWFLQVGTAFALVIILFLLGRSLKQSPAKESSALWWAGLLGSALLLVAPTLTGHAAASAKEYPFAKTTDWLHLAAAGVWVGGLFHLALTIPKALSTLKTQDRLRVLHRVIPLFTRLAVVSTILIVLTGVYNSWMHVDRFGKLWSTGYGKTLSLKVLLVVPMLILGGVNTFVFHPRASRLIENENADSRHTAALDRNFARSVRIEALLGVAVLLVASILVFQQPARESTEGQLPQYAVSQPVKK